jgi:hypothetical protein
LTHLEIKAIAEDVKTETQWEHYAEFYRFAWLFSQYLNTQQKRKKYKPEDFIKRPDDKPPEGVELGKKILSVFKMIDGS